MKKIIVYCEKNKENKLLNVSFELCSKARLMKNKAIELNGEDFIVEAIVLSDELSNEDKIKLFTSGANRVVLLKNNNLKNFNQVVFAKTFVEYYKNNQSDIILFPATPLGRILAPRITSTLNTGLTADCTNVDIILKDENIYLASTRPTFGAELMATILSKTKPQCATIRPNTFEVQYQENIGEYLEVETTTIEENRIKFLSSIVDTISSDMDITKAKIILAMGYGVTDGKDKKYLLRLEKIAKKIGAKVACTRKIVDMGLMDHSAQIGQTGITVHSDLYIAFGISGAIQHVSGMKTCRKVIAINTNKNAEIFKYADYKIVADAKKVIDDLLERVERVV